MLDSPSEHFSVSAVLLKRPSANRWATASWTLLGTVPGLEAEALQQAATQGELITIPGLKLELFRRHCDAYYINLMSPQPKVYLVCNQEQDELKPLLMTVDFDEAASFMETGELVLDAPLADALCVWLEHYVVAHYLPEKPKKRKRQNWHDDNAEPAP